MSKIREQPIGSTALDANSYNAIARAARAFENLSFNQEQFNVQRDLTGMYVSLEEQPVENCGRGIIRKTDSLNVGVSAIDWTRNGFKVNAAATTIAVPDDATSFIVIELKGAPITNPSLAPFLATIKAVATIEDLVGGSGQEGTIWVLGSVVAASGDITTVTQLWCGGDVDDKWVIPDAISLTGIAQATISRRASFISGVNTGELQLKDSDLLVLDGAAHVTQLTGATVVAVPAMAVRGAAGVKLGALTWVLPTPVILPNFDIVVDVLLVATVLSKTKRLLTVNAGIWETIGAPVTTPVV